MNADVYEEGDFLVSTFGFPLGQDIERSKLLTELKVWGEEERGMYDAKRAHARTKRDLDVQEVEEELQNKVKLRKGQTKGLPKSTCTTPACVT
jgi:hypothetical protein